MEGTLCYGEPPGTNFGKHINIADSQHCLANAVVRDNSDALWSGHIAV